MPELVYLDGTVGNNPWRRAVITALEFQNIESGCLFSPPANDWTDESRQQIAVARRQATVWVFYIGNPMGADLPVGADTMVQATIALFDQPENTVVVIDTAGMQGRALQATEEVKRQLQQRFPHVRILNSIGELVEALVRRLSQQNTR